MQFILEQQAQFAADIQKLIETQQKLAEEQVRLTEGHVRLAEAILANTGMIGRLAEAQARSDERIADLAARLDAFIVVVEKYISEGRNGTSKS